MVWNTDSEGASLVNGQRNFGQFIQLYPNGGDSSLFAINQAITNNDLGVPGGLSQNETEAYLSMLGVDVDEDTQEHYNDHCYLVLDGLPLTYDYSNNLPTLEALCATENDPAVREIIFDLCRMANYQPEEIDVTAMESRVIAGFALDARKPARQAIAELYSYQPFDVIKRGKKLIFQDRPDGNVWNVPFGDLGAKAVRPGDRSPTDLYDIKPVPGEVLPQTLTFLPYDSENYYQQSRFSIRREVLDLDGYVNQDERSFSAPIVLSPTQAQTTLERLFHELWTERIEYTFNLPRKYLAMEPGDFLDFSNEWGLLKVESITYGANLILQVKASQFEQQLYGTTSRIQADYNQREVVPVSRVIPLPPMTTITGIGRKDTTVVFNEGTDYTVDTQAGRVNILPGGSIQVGEDINVIYRTDQTQPATDFDITGEGTVTAVAIDTKRFNIADPSYSVYLYANSDSSEWRGVSFYGSRDNQNFTFLSTQASRAVIGAINGDFVGGQIVVTLSPLSPALISVTAQDIAGGANKALAGNEIIQFQTATQIGTDMWQLSDVTRAVDGTTSEQLASGDRFVLLNSPNARLQASAGDVGSVLYFKAVGAYESVSEAPTFVIDYLSSVLCDDKNEILLSDLNERLAPDLNPSNVTPYQGLNS